MPPRMCTVVVVVVVYVFNERNSKITIFTRFPDKI